MSLKRAGANYVLDCTAQRSHKTSKLSVLPTNPTSVSPSPPLSPSPVLTTNRSYGPSATTLSPMLSKVIDLFLAELTFDAIEDDTPCACAVCVCVCFERVQQRAGVCVCVSG